MFINTRLLDTQTKQGPTVVLTELCIQG